jgi:hypothetical protein
MESRGHLSDRLRERLQRESFPESAIDRLERADFSSGRSLQSAASASHNERIHVGIVIVSERLTFDAAVDLAMLDWRDLLVAAGLADGDWPQRVDAWFDESEHDARQREQRGVRSPWR